MAKITVLGAGGFGTALAIMLDKYGNDVTIWSVFQHEIDMLENEESEVVSVINLSKKWRTANYEERKAVCNILIHKILINETGDCEVIWNI